MDKMEKVIDWLNNNTNELFSIVGGINSYDGSLEEFEWFDMEMLDEMLEGKTPTEIINLVTEDFFSGDSYFRFNGYGHLISTNSYSIEQDMVNSIDEIAERVIDLDRMIDFPDELQEILDQEDE